MKLAQITGIDNPSTRFTDYATLPATVMGRALLFAISAAGLYFFYQLIMSGVSYMTAFGDESRIQQVTKQLTNAAFGLIIVISAYFILSMLETITGADLI